MKAISAQENDELRLDGTAVSRGFAVGCAVRFYGGLRQFFRASVIDVDAEIERFQSAVKQASRQLEELALAREGNASAEIFGVHRMMLEDSELTSKTIAAIKKEKINAEWALKIESELRLDQFLSANDAHLREKAVDLEDVMDRVRDFLAGGVARIYLQPESVFVASEIQPSTLIAMAETPPAAIVAEHGGWTSHAFIIAREINIPAVAGVKNALRFIRDGERVAVNGNNGMVTVRPLNTSSSFLGNAHKVQQINTVGLFRTPSSITADGKAISLAANAETPESIGRSIEQGADGIGLLRSEYLFDLRRGLPDFQTQLEGYRLSFEAARGKPCRIRTFDIPADRLSNRASEKEKNPALGLRGIRHSLADEGQFREQLSAILQASRNANVEIVLPLISSVDEVRRAKDILAVEASKAGVIMPRLGCLIEVPAAVFAIDSLLSHLDFVCIGSNDLVQYLVAADRDNDAVAATYQTLHPAVLRALKIVIDAARSAGKPRVLCGEMAGSPFYTPLLIGLGFTSLSMTISSMSRVRDLIPSISTETARDLAARMLKVETVGEAETLLFKFHHDHLANATGKTVGTGKSLKI